MKKFILTIFIAVLFGPNFGVAQTGIDNLTVIPAVLTASSNIQVTANITVPSSPCYLISDSVSISSYTIDVYSTHYMGVLTAICHTTDTITIGSLQPGSYCLLFHLIGQNPADTYTLDVDTVCFTVDQLSGLTEYSQKSKKFEIFPNPISSYFTLKSLADSFKHFDVEIFDLYGQRLSSVKQINSKTPIDVVDLQIGTYVLVISDGNIRQRTKIIKSTP